MSFRATVQLTDLAGHVLAEIGETCERVPEQSLGWLQEQGLIVPIEKRRRKEILNG